MEEEIETKKTKWNKKKREHFTQKDATNVVINEKQEDNVISIKTDKKIGDVILEKNGIPTEKYVPIFAEFSNPLFAYSKEIQQKEEIRKKQTFITENFQEGLGPLCSGNTNSPKAKEINKHIDVAKGQLSSVLNYPFFLVDFYEQAIADIVCDIFVETPSGIISLVNNTPPSTIKQTLVDLSNTLITDNTLLGLDANGLPLPTSSVVDLSGNLMNFTDTLAGVGADGNGGGETIDYNVLNSVASDLNSDLLGTYCRDENGNFNYQKWLEHVNTKSKDNQLVKKYINLVFIVFLSWFFSYNWFFIFFYKSPEKEKTEIETIIHDKSTSFFNRMVERMTKKFMEIFYGDTTEYNVPFFSKQYVKDFSPFLFFFIHHISLPVIWLNNYLIIKLPQFVLSVAKIMPSLLNPLGLWMLVYATIIYLITQYGHNIQKMINACIEYSPTNTTEYSIYFSLLFVIATYSLVSGLATFENAIKIYMGSFFSLLLLATVLLIQLVITFMIVPISGLVPVFYLLIYSFLALVLYNGLDLFGGMKMIRDYIYRHSFADEIDEENSGCGSRFPECESKTIWEQIMSFISKRSKFAYNFSIEIAILFMLFRGITEYTTNMESAELKAGMVILSVICMCGIIGIIGVRNYMGLTKSNHTNTAPKTNQTNLFSKLFFSNMKRKSS
jgi:predicted membrane protein